MLIYNDKQTFFKKFCQLPNHSIYAKILPGMYETQKNPFFLIKIVWPKICGSS